MKIDEAIEILKNMNDGYTFSNCRVCIADNAYDEKEGICKSKTCEYLQAIETIVKEYQDIKNMLVRRIKYSNKLEKDLFENANLEKLKEEMRDI